MPVDAAMSQRNSESGQARLGKFRQGENRLSQRSRGRELASKATRSTPPPLPPYLVSANPFQVRPFPSRKDARNTSVRQLVSTSKCRALIRRTVCQSCAEDV